MKFILQMARREMRASWHRLLFFFVCIAVGVAAIVAVRSIIRNFHGVFTNDAREILTADIQIDSNHPWSEETLRRLERALQGFTVQNRIQTIEASTMLRPADPALEGAIMVEMKGIESPFPFYGKFILQDGKSFSYSMLENNGALVGPSVLTRLDLKVGDRIKIGDSVFQIRGVVERDPGGGTGFRWGPRIMVDRAALESAGLTGFGSRARRKILLKLPEKEVDPALKQLRRELSSNLLRIRSYKESGERMDRQFTRAEDFLSLTGLVILVLGGIGISSVTRVFIDQKKKTIAILKCVGGSGPKVIAAYLLQVCSLGLGGSLLGVGIAKLALYTVGSRYASVLPPGMTYGLQWGAVWQGLVVGMLVTVLFSALPLLQIRRIKPSVLLREEDQIRPPRFDWLRWGAAAVVSAGLVVVSSWQAGSLRVGFFFLLGLAVAALALRLTAMLLMWIVRRARHISSFPLRHAINSLYRPGNQTQVIILAAGLGVFFILTTQSVQMNLLSEFDLGRRDNMANMYLIDIQKDQREGISEIIKEGTGRKEELIPTVRARIFAVNGTQINPELPDYKKDRNRLGHEYTLTYRDRLQPNETLLEGKFWPPTPSSEPEISIEEDLKGMMGLEVGGMITWDIQGRKITSRVTSIRRVDWRNSRTGFYVVFRPGVLEAAPANFVAAVNGPTQEPQRSRFQRKLVDAYPNVTVIDVDDILRNITRIIDTVSAAVSFLGAFVLLSGLLILIGSIAMTKYQRIYESAVLKTLGAKREVILRILLLEYGLLGLAAGIVGALGAVGLSYAVTHFVLEIPWSGTPLLYPVGAVVAIVVLVLVGAASSMDVIRHKPLGFLRTQ